MNIEERLRLYRKNKADVETTLQRISVWKEILSNGNLQDLIWTPVITLGMPKAPGHNISSPIEKEICNKEINAETVKNWIKDDNSRIFMKKLEVVQIENALTSLTKEQKYVIECKYFENWTWRNIEINYNKQEFRKDYMTDSGIRKIKDEAIRLIIEILEPFYNQLKVC